MYCVDMLMLKGSDHRLSGLRNLGADLCVIKLKGWDNDKYFFYLHQQRYYWCKMTHMKEKMIKTL